MPTSSAIAAVFTGASRWRGQEWWNNSGSPFPRWPNCWRTKRDGLDIELMDCRGPLGQRGVLGVERHQVVDIPQQVGPAPLLGAIVMVVGGVEIADQHSGERLAQRLVHHRLAPTPPQEVAFGGGAESPDVTVVPILAPAGFVGVDHWAGADAVQDAATAGWACCAVW